MSEMFSVKEAAMRWKLTERRVSKLCKDGMIKGAIKQGNRWMIPVDTQKPADRCLLPKRMCPEAPPAYRCIQLSSGFFRILLYRQNNDDQRLHR